ncbi:tRNA (adenosine(37)-N6)-dimethylallyltransferase MiaA [uncultured Roseobacter sp.]|uniref:tRNA (adenosine(37)-N6)-dimethylallyltransferase MiaA n=1 Tax=uncultured Roseobacter sp. TaxID=114847 RepID=UPI002636C70C|nr:tRNA (adenosine(37)-N6)-dimethylallyltransferase MiaA [uncultured Roseobacter sp.]
MTLPEITATASLIAGLSREKPLLIAGPTASGKSAVALEVAARHGGVIVNADASQVYDCWRVLTARPSVEEEAAATHLLYGHHAATSSYSAGHWLREVAAVLAGDARPIIVGGTGLYFAALTRGLAEIPATPAQVRARGDAMALADMLAALDPATRDAIDTANRARVQRAWEVQETTGRGLRDWQRDTGAPLLPERAADCVVFTTPKEVLNARIARRFEAMLSAGALEEARAVLPSYDPALPAHRAIGAPELIAHLKGELTRQQAAGRAIIATRQFAKRQRTWFRSKMRDWQAFAPAG